ncbi:LysR substrate-binding domain-containing protein [Microbacterium tumbae]
MLAPIPEFTLRQLAYLVAVADAGTIAAAADLLHISASALSDALTELDRAFGEPLTVRRRARGATLTSAGATVVQHARPLLADGRALAGILDGEPGELVGPITIGCYPTLAPTILPPLLHEFGEAHPRIDLHFMESTHDQLGDRIDSGEVDVAFVYDTLVPGQPRRERLHALAAHVLVAADDPLAGRDAVTLEEVVDRDLILLDAPPSSAHTLSLFAARGLTPRIRHRTSSYEAVRTLVGRGLGYGILVQRPANPATYEGYPVVMKEIAPAVEPVGIDVIWSSTIEPPQRVQALIAFAHSIAWAGARS